MKKDILAFVFSQMLLTTYSQSSTPAQISSTIKPTNSSKETTSHTGNFSTTVSTKPLNSTATLMTNRSDPQTTGNVTLSPTNSTATLAKVRLDDIAASDKISLVARIILGIIFIFGTIFGIVGNVLVLLAVGLTKTLRMHIPNLWVCNLSITDLLVSCFSLPILGVYMSVYWPNWPFGDTLCKVSVYVANVCAMESINTLVIIAIDRYFAVIRNKVLISRRAFYVLSIVTWILTAGALSYPLTNSGGVTYEKLNNITYGICQRMSGRHLLNREFRNTSIFKISAGFIIIGLLVGLYTCMGVSIFKMRHSPTEENRNKSIRSKSVKQADKNKTKAVKMLFVVVLLFLLSWGPYWIVTFLRVFPLSYDHFVEPTIVITTYALAMLNSVWNPILYALMSRSFRRAYGYILKGKRMSRYGSTSRTRSTLKTRVSSRASVLSTGTTKTPVGSTMSLGPVKERSRSQLSVNYP